MSHTSDGPQYELRWHENGQWQKMPGEYDELVQEGLKRLHRAHISGVMIVNSVTGSDVWTPATDR